MPTTYQTVNHMYLARIAATPNDEAFQFFEGGTWKTFSWKQTDERVRAIAGGLRALGMSSEQRASILMSTRIEWILADLGIMLAGGAATTIYPSNTADECAYIVNDSETAFVFAENAAQVKKLVAKRAEMPSVKKVILIDGKPDADTGDWVVGLADFMESGKRHDAAHPGECEAVAQAVKSESLATLIYTSGTTGQPKGVELTHSCWAYEGWCLEETGLVKQNDRQYLWLPLSHVFGKVLEMGQLQIGFATTVDGRIDKLVENLGIVKPTFVAAVPRIFEKVHNKVVEGAQAGGGLKLAIFRWAMKTGREGSLLRQKGQEPSGLLAVKLRIADKLVFSKLKARFGGRIRFFISGGAPLSRELTEFFHAAGILICEGYGLTESSAASFVNRPEKYRFGTVGLLLPGTEVKIMPEDGEILLRGKGIMRGYHNKPEATAEAIDADGWLHTGDIGTVQAEGFLQITDRKKDLIKTSGGKYVAPQAVEGQMKALCPYISQVVVHGNNRNFCSALITLDEESIRRWANENGLGGASYADLSKNPKVKTLIQGYVDQLNKTLPSYETLKKFAILDTDLTQEAGYLTASLKVKRKVVEADFKAVLDAFYAGTLSEA